MRWFLLIAGYDYPDRDVEDGVMIIKNSRDDWIGCFETERDALEAVQSEDNGTFTIDGESYDWYSIIDLRTWVRE